MTSIASRSTWYWLGSFLVDFLFWGLPGGIFVLVYTERYGLSGEALTPNMALMGLLYTFSLLWRFSLPTQPNQFWQLATALVLALSSFFGMLFFLAQAIGLYFWHIMLSWFLIMAYSMQLNSLPGMSWASPTVVIIVLLFLWILTATVFYFLWRTGNWATHISHNRQIAGPRIFLLTATFGFILGVFYYRNDILTLMGYEEAINAQSSKNFVEIPKSKTGVTDFEGHSIDNQVSAVLDAQAKIARDNYQAKTSNPPVNLIFIVSDALRADHTNLYGYVRPTMPHLAGALKTQHGLLVPNVHAVCSDTACGMLTLLSSIYPANISYHPFTLHQALEVAGYKVHLIMSGNETSFYNLRAYYGRLDSFVDGLTSHQYTINDDQMVLDRVAALPAYSGQPVMLHLHLMATHILRKIAGYPNDYAPAMNYWKPSTWLPENRPAFTNFYDNGVRRADVEIDAILHDLQEKHYLDHALVVITGDHGDGMGEHGLYIHGNSVYDEVLRVPVIILPYGTSLRPLSVTTNHPTQVDIAPTILSEMGFPVPPSWQGHNLTASQTPYISYFEENKDMGLMDRRQTGHLWKYWWNTEYDTEHVFDLITDPGEKHDRLAEILPKQIHEWHNLVAEQAMAAKRNLSEP